MAAPAVDQAFEDLYASYSREVYRYVLALLRNPAEAEDVTQTTFLNAYRALRAGERPRRPHNWLIAIAHNACRSRVRFAMRRPNEVPLDDVVEQLAVPELERPNIRELLRTMGRLPVNQRAAITMREFEGRSYVDIAERLGVTVPAAEALIGRARRMLRERAAAFRTLLLVPKPRWFRRFAENGEAAGGAAGTAAAAKVAALLVIGAVGVVAGSSSQVPSAQTEPAAAARQLASRDSPAALTRVPAARPAATVVASAAQPQAAPLPADAMAAGPSAAATSSAAVPTPPAAPVTAGTTAGTTVTAAVAQVTDAITTVVSALPTVTTPAVSTTLPVTTPAVTTPVGTVPPVTVPTLTVPTVTVPPLP